MVLNVAFWLAMLAMEGYQQGGEFCRDESIIAEVSGFKYQFAVTYIQLYTDITCNSNPS